MVIRDAGAGDITVLTAMLNDMYSEIKYGISFNEDFFKSRIKSRFFIIKILEEDGQALGFSTVKITKSDYTPEVSSMGFLYELYIKPEIRKKGYARLLLSEMEKELKESGIDYMELYVRLDNENGMGFWLRNGCKPIYHVLSKKLI